MYTASVFFAGAFFAALKYYLFLGIIGGGFNIVIPLIP